MKPTLLLSKLSCLHTYYRYESAFSQQYISINAEKCYNVSNIYSCSTLICSESLDD